MKESLSFEEYSSEWLSNQLSKKLICLFANTKKLFPNTYTQLNSRLHQLAQQAKQQVRISKSAGMLVKALAECKPGVDAIIFDKVKVVGVIDLATTNLPKKHCPAEYYFAMAYDVELSSDFGFREFEVLLTPLLQDVRMVSVMTTGVPRLHFSRLWAIRRAFLLLDLWMIAHNRANPLSGSVGYARGLGSEIVSLSQQMEVIVAYNSQAT